MLISYAKLKLAAVECTPEFMDFAHYYGIAKHMEAKRNQFLSGVLTMETAEMENPREEMNVRYVNALTAAARKLFTLDRAFYKKNREHIHVKLDDISMIQRAFDEMDQMLATN